MKPPSRSPFAPSFVAAMILVASFVAIELALGRLPLVFGPASHPRGDFRVALVLIALIAYLPGALALGRAKALETLAELAPALANPPAAKRDALARVLADFESPALTRLRAGGAIGVVLLLALPLATNWTFETWDLRRLPPEAIAHRVLLPVVGWFLGRLVVSLVSDSRSLAVLARELVAVDLLDLRPLAPITRQAMRNALLAAGLLSISSLGLADVDIAPNLFLVLGCLLAANALFSAGVLLIPLRGMRDAIARSKGEEIERTCAALRLAREGGANAPSLADTLAWRGYVQDLPEWPFDAPTLLRMVLYLAIPLGSWLGGALVERVLDWVLT